MSATDLRNVLTKAIAVKRIMCRAQGFVDLEPVLEIRWSDGKVSETMLPDRDAIAPIAKALQRERIMEAVIVSVAFVGDAVVKDYANSDVGEDGPGRGAVQAAREAGDMTVGDVLVASVIDLKGEVAAGSVPYHYDDAGQPVFGQVELERDLMGGGVVDALRAAMAR